MFMTGVLTEDTRYSCVVYLNMGRYGMCGLVGPRHYPNIASRPNESGALYTVQS